MAPAPGLHRGLRRSRELTDVEVVLIDRRNHHIFQPLLYQVATKLASDSRATANSGRGNIVGGRESRIIAISDVL